MATKTVVCPECAEALPYGRLSCPACGALLASVAGAARRVPSTEPARQPASDDRPAADDDAEQDVVDPESEAAAPDADVADPAGEVADPRRDAGGGTPDAAGPTDARETSGPDDEPTVASPRVPPVLRDWVEPDPGPPAAAVAAWPPGPAAGAPVPPVRAPLVAGPPFEPAGAYLPPSAVFAPGPAAAGAEARAAGGRQMPRAGEANLLADLPFDLPDDLPGWLVAAGAGMASVGFLLPWAPQLIGSAGVGGYLDRWGLAAPMHLPVFLAGLAVLVAAIVPNRVPAWVRAGVVPLALGGLLLGLVWPYLVGPLRGGLGAMTEAIGAVLLLFGGVLAVRPRRHEDDRPAV